MFQDMHNGQIDQAARAACALLVSRSIKGAQVLVDREWQAVLDQHLQASGFLATSERRWNQYSEAIARNWGEHNEHSTNRAWGEYSSAVQSAARALANGVQDEMAVRYEEAMRELAA